ncbi:MAG TPA: glycosyltransferase family A protein [Allosphingosinicella sp.]|nr:glycosyltransferase family A protein [Allosphingosinicella sp.]
MPVAFVIPCLNEEQYLAAAAASLGFGERAAARADEDVHLILVDNGSTDGTLTLMKAIAASSRPGTVHVVSEPERGFVPPRRRGVVLAAEMADGRGIPADRLLILQADADTVYWPDYARWMWDRLQGRRGLLLEGALRRSEDFDAKHVGYRALERLVDEGLECDAVEDADDVVVDDKACGYLLADYFSWGGQFREYDAAGSEIHAETTRLFIRAHLRHGVEKLRVNPAQATASRRRIIADPALHFATKGFPREAAWIARWRERHPHTRSVDEFARDPEHPEVREACFYRRAHEIALFELLPSLVARTAGSGLQGRARARVQQLLSLLPDFSADELAAAPGRAITAVLDMIETRSDLFR